MASRPSTDEADEWVLNGTKAWITNGGIADIHVVVGVVEPDLKSKGHASFIIPPNTPGLSQGQKYKKHGIRASHTAEVVLDDVRIPGSMLLGGKEKLDERIARVREGKPGNAQAAMQTFEATRPSVGAQALGIARAAYEIFARVRQGARDIRPTDHHESGDRVHARRHGDRDRGDARHDPPRRLAR